ncbi:Reverse transcriptase (RNA-dependent DNA polymerase) [Popillia japonica]|uniref:Reverse transcriptase (RNA-dependent DNA polymerase) n=1 Tax=Popillia japonica TaxID=7064 RepID=A0AAW1JXC6_POPJA
MLGQEFVMKDLGEVKSCFGMNIVRDRKQNKIWIDQAGYIEKILDTFKMTDCKPLSTPMNLDLKDLITRTGELAEKVADNRTPWVASYTYHRFHGPTSHLQ